ncbi:MAG: PAS domain S-box protein [Anaerolineales bacterium]|nr:PAS domain S-box protein [Anaerolineales bacterium]
MRSSLLDWLRPPVFAQDEEKNRKVRLLHPIVLALFSIALLYLAFAPLEITHWRQRLLIIVPFLLIVGCVWWAMRRGMVKFAGIVIVTALWGMFTLAMSFGSGFNNPAYMGYVIVVVCAGLLLSQRAAILWAGISILTSTVIWQAAEHGLLPEVVPFPPNIAFWMAQTMYILVIATLLSLALRVIEDALAQARQQLTERIAAENALRASETRLRMVFENLGEGVCVQNHDWTYTYANPAAHTILGWPLGTLIGKNEGEIFSPTSLSTIQQQNLQRAVGHITTYEVDILRPDSEVRTLLATGVPRLDDQGNLQEIFVTFMDITERKRLEKELAQEHEFLQQIVQTMGQGLTVIDEKDEFVLLNPAFLRMTGYTMEELVGKHPVDLTMLASHTALDQARSDRMQGKVTTYENILQRKDGTKLPILVTGAPRWQANQYAGAISVLTDLTEIKQKETTLQATAEELQNRNASLQIINEIAFNLHRSGQIQQIAEEAVHALQAYSQSPMIALYLLEKETQTFKLYAQFGFQAETVEKGKNLPVEGSLSGLTLQRQTIVTSDDLVNDLRVTPSMREALGREGLQCVISIPLLFQQDVFGVVNLIFRGQYILNASQRETLLAIGKTIGLAIANAHHLAQAQNEAIERRRAEEKIRQLNAFLEQRVVERTTQLEEANRELESFAYSISHDLRSPLRAIEGFITLLLETAEPPEESQRHYLRRVYENSQRMAQLIEDLLTFSRLGRKPLKKRTVSITELLAEMLEDLAPELRTREVEWHISPDLPPCNADPALLRQVFANLLDNALKYTRPRPVAHIEVAWIEQEGSIVYFVQDNGVGFNMEYVGKLFGVFQRLHGQEEFEGTGVGLANVQRIIHRHGGRIWVEAAVNQGATFYFTIPG